MINIWTGHSCRTERERLDRMPLGTLSALTGISIGTISKIENGQGSIRDSTRECLQEAFTRVEKLRLALLPARLDMKNATALKEALAAFEAGNLARAAEHATAPRLPDPLVATY